MPGTYAYTPAIWPPLVACVVLAAIGHYAWRRRDGPGGKSVPADSADVSTWTANTLGRA
jgi:hypothetical protein